MEKGGVGGRGVGGVARMVAHLPASHPPELGMTRFCFFFEAPLISLPHQINPWSCTHSPHLNLNNTSLPHAKIPSWLASPSADVVEYQSELWIPHRCCFVTAVDSHKERVLFWMLQAQTHVISLSSKSWDPFRAGTGHFEGVGMHHYISNVFSNVLAPRSSRC